MHAIKIAFRMSLFLFVGILLSTFLVSTVAQNKQTSLAGTTLFPNENYEGWVETQNDPTIGERSKIINTVNTYFIIKYESWLKEMLLDFGFLFDQTDEVAFEDYAYERGLLHLMLTGWRYSNTLLNHYDYKPEFNKISLVKNNAKVIMRPHSTVIFRDDPNSMYEGASTDHEFELVSQNGNWLIQSIRCNDPAHNIHPRGSDFNQLAATLIERTKADLANEKDNALELSEDPRIAARAFLRQKRLISINQEIAFGFKNNETLIDIMVASDNIEIKFGPMKGYEPDFFAGGIDIPQTKIESITEKNQLVITFKKTNLHDRLKSYAIQPGETSPYFNHVRLLEEGENSLLVLGLKNTAKFYTGEIKRFRDSSSVVFMFSIKDSSK